MDFEEGCLRFSFGNEWRVIKYDDSPVYREHISKLPETKAVDFIGLHAGDLFLIEVKDLRGFRIQNQARLTSGDLAIEVGQKVRDTLAGIIGAYRTASEPETWQDFANLLTNRAKKIKVIVWLEYDQPIHHRDRQKVEAGVEGNLIKKHLRWLTAQVIVCNQAGRPLEHLNVANLPRTNLP
jgi:hypothetical protein